MLKYTINSLSVKAHSERICMIKMTHIIGGVNDCSRLDIGDAKFLYKRFSGKHLDPRSVTMRANAYDIRRRVLTCMDHEDMQSPLDFSPSFVLANWIEGTPLNYSDLVENEALGFEARSKQIKGLLEFGHAILEPLGTLLDHGVVHRDLKPSNIVLKRTAEGLKVCLIDGDFLAFGNNSSDGRLVGSPALMAPEMAAEQKSSPTLDVHSLGAILIRLLNKEHLIEGGLMPSYVHGDWAYDYVCKVLALLNELHFIQTFDENNYRIRLLDIMRKLQAIYLDLGFKNAWGIIECGFQCMMPFGLRTGDVRVIRQFLDSTPPVDFIPSYEAITPITDFKEEISAKTGIHFLEDASLPA